MPKSRLFLRPVMAVPFAALVAFAACGPNEGGGPVDDCAHFASTDSVYVPEPAPGTTAPKFVGVCLSRDAELHDGVPVCIVLQGRVDSACDCNTPGLQAVSDVHEPAIEEAKELDSSGKLDCFCEVVALAGGAAEVCRYGIDEPLMSEGQPVDGYCYLDEKHALGDPEIYQACSDDRRQFLRFVGEVGAATERAYFAFCQQTICPEDEL